MDSYLRIAREILLRERRPLGPRAILAAAYQYGLVPSHLFGKTQHKTLQARVSEDIIARRDRSAFFRPRPGKFFLRELLTDTSLPEEYRRPIATRRRMRELVRGPALAVDVNQLNKIATINRKIKPGKIFNILQKENYYYADKNIEDKNLVFIWSFVTVWRHSEVLAYRLGKYRENRDSFMMKKSIGFSTLVNQSDRTLFDFDDYGIVHAGARAAKIDLDIPAMERSIEEERSRSTLLYFLWTINTSVHDLLAVIRYDCPDWFEPAKRRLAINDMHWLDSEKRNNNMEDFDPWSKIVINERRWRMAGSGFRD